jgi:MtaA/CmuA family methyltransferase
MNKKQKFNALLSGTLPGNEVLFYPILMHFAARYNGHNYGELASDYKVLVESNVKCLEHFDTDMVSLISDPYRETSAFGASVEFVAEGVPICRKSIVQNPDDVIRLEIPDPYKNQRTLDRIRGAVYYQELLKGTVPVMGWVEGPLAEACDLAGVSHMLMMLMTDEDFCNSLMDKCLTFAKLFAKTQIEAGCDLIGIGDAICSQIDEFTYVNYVKARHIELIDYIHSLGSKVKLHICGNTTHLLPHIAGLSVDIFDPDIVDQEECFSALGQNVIRSGNINPVFIENASPEEVFNACRKVIAAEKGRKFMLSAGCEITVRTPPENVMAMSESRKK